MAIALGFGLTLALLLNSLHRPVVLTDEHVSLLSLMDTFKELLAGLKLISLARVAQDLDDSELRRAILLESTEEVLDFLALGEWLPEQEKSVVSLLVHGNVLVEATFFILDISRGLRHLQ